MYYSIFRSGYKFYTKNSFKNVCFQFILKKRFKPFDIKTYYNKKEDLYLAFCAFEPTLV